MTNTHVVVPLRVAAPATRMTPGFERLFAASVGVIVLPLYAPQPLVDLIGPSLGLSLRAASLVAMTSMLGYAAGLVLLVPLIDVSKTGVRFCSCSSPTSLRSPARLRRILRCCFSSPRLRADAQPAPYKWSFRSCLVSWMKRIAGGSSATS
jgi:hypothetical protein